MANGKVWTKKELFGKGGPRLKFWVFETIFVIQLCGKVYCIIIVIIIIVIIILLLTTYIKGEVHGIMAIDRDCNRRGAIGSQVPHCHPLLDGHMTNISWLQYEDMFLSQMRWSNTSKIETREKKEWWQWERESKKCGNSTCMIQLKYKLDMYEKY